MGWASRSLAAAARHALPAGLSLCLAAAAAVVTAGPAAAAVVTAGAVEHWGTYEGDGGKMDRNLSPVSLSLPAPVAEMGSSNSAQYALLTNGTVYAWGVGGEGQLGDGRTGNSFTTPVRVKFPSGVKIASIAADVSPFNSALAIDTQGHAWGWGLNPGGALCLGQTQESLTPVKLPFSDVTALAGGLSHATYDAGGTLYSCGTNSYGELGDGTTASSRTPVKVTGLDGSAVTSLVASWGNTGALLSDGSYYDWGYNAAGQVGDGGTASVTSPYQVPLPAPVTAVGLGGSVAYNGETIVLMHGGLMAAWGNGKYYQLGNGAKGDETSPVSISPPRGVQYQSVACGGATCYAISTSGAVYAWGANKQGQVGDGTTTGARHPVEVITGSVTGISATAADVAVSESSATRRPG